MGGWAGGGGVGGGDGWEAGGGLKLPYAHDSSAVSSESDSIHWTGRHSRWQQFGISHILIGATHWPHRPCIAPWWFDRVGNKPSVKADLTIYSYVLGIFR